MAPMAKWKPYKQSEPQPQQTEAPAVAQPEAHLLPRGRWMRVQPTRENGVSGWILDELIQNADGSFSCKRIHGPDLFDITNYRHESEVAQ